MDYVIVNSSDLPRVGNAHEFEGYLFGDTNVSLILVDAPIGGGPRLHRHPYEEVFVIQEGQATFTVGSATIEAQAGQMVIVPKGVPHKFVNSGKGPLRQINIHPNKHFITEWLEA